MFYINIITIYLSLLKIQNISKNMTLYLLKKKKNVFLKLNIFCLKFWTNYLDPPSKLTEYFNNFAIETEEFCTKLPKCLHHKLFEGLLKDYFLKHILHDARIPTIKITIINNRLASKHLA